MVAQVSTSSQRHWLRETADPKKREINLDFHPLSGETYAATSNLAV